MNSEHLSPSEAARVLNVSEHTLRRWIRQGLFRRVGANGQISRSELLRWARAHGISAVFEKPAAHEPAPHVLADAVASGAVITDAAPTSAVETIEVVIRSVPGIDESARARLAEEVLDRECMAGTGLGDGIALPHPREAPAWLLDEPLICVCLPEQPVDWAAFDNVPVFAAFLVLSPSPPAHLEVLARIAFVLRDSGFREFLRTRPQKDELVTQLRSIRKP